MNRNARRRIRSFALDGCVTGDGTSAADVSEAEYLEGFGQRHGAIARGRIGAAVPTPGSLANDIDRLPNH